MTSSGSGMDALSAITAPGFPVEMVFLDGLHYLGHTEEALGRDPAGIRKESPKDAAEKP